MAATPHNAERKPAATTDAMKEFLEYIKARNRATLAWVAAGPNRWSTVLPEDEAHWQARGITTIAAYEHEELVTNVWEGLRSAYGYKANWAAINAQDDATLKVELEKINAVIRADIEREEREEQEHKAATESAMAHRSGFTIGELVSL